ncbi:uncharacterized protein CLUP02_08120 [Colletotrichum lupini]|uniref:Uncharacterized protein n=1 Tax=Colletotrichum lupini TaxID=145971 RepID=A0A9Q8ST80_9PEZI|nr:uncharacterized protein CLUP02_08120 [Colletotrichum lupini]UQC82630.1 hypothetical protein CLUP02_08120 [Colletotrichum lupini]
MRQTAETWVEPSHSTAGFTLRHCGPGSELSSLKCDQLSNRSLHATPPRANSSNPSLFLPFLSPLPCGPMVHHVSMYLVSPHASQRDDVQGTESLPRGGSHAPVQWYGAFSYFSTVDRRKPMADAPLFLLPKPASPDFHDNGPLFLGRQPTADETRQDDRPLELLENIVFLRTDWQDEEANTSPLPPHSGWSTRTTAEPPSASLPTVCSVRRECDSQGSIGLALFGHRATVVSRMRREKRGPQEPRNLESPWKCSLFHNEDLDLDRREPRVRLQLDESLCPLLSHIKRAGGYNGVSLRRPTLCKDGSPSTHGRSTGTSYCWGTEKASHPRSKQASEEASDSYVAHLGCTQHSHACLRVASIPSTGASLRRKRKKKAGRYPRHSGVSIIFSVFNSSALPTLKSGPREPAGGGGGGSSSTEL